VFSFELEEDLQSGQNVDLGFQSDHHSDHDHHLPFPATKSITVHKDVTPTAYFLAM